MKAMQLGEAMQAAHSWSDANSAAILVASVVYPLASTAVAYVGRGGKTDEDGVFMANVAVTAAVAVFLLGALLLFMTLSLTNATLLDVNVALIIAPPITLAGTVLGVRKVFPLERLVIIQTLRDVALFVIACAGLVWFFSMFRGWGIVFFGGIFQLVILLGLAAFVIHRLYRRAFGRR